MAFSYSDINNVYQSLLGRDADAAGANYWMQQPGMDLGGLQMGVLNSQEAQSRPAGSFNLGGANDFSSNLNEFGAAKNPGADAMWNSFHAQLAADAAKNDPMHRQQQAYQKMQGGSFAGGLLSDAYSDPFGGQITGQSKDQMGNPWGAGFGTSAGSGFGVFGAKNPYSAV